jgi:REP element-mobilizing transposase RayT
MAYIKLLIHAVWGTKNRENFIKLNLRANILSHIQANASKKEVFIDTINSQPDHIHCLFYLNADMSVAKAIHLIKGESSFWINKQKLVVPKFEWADEYFAASVSESQKNKVRGYILDQDEHHRTLSFAEEYDKFLKCYGYTSHG